MVNLSNAVCETFNGSVRRECLSQAYFLSYVDAQQTFENWKRDHNNHRPHSSLQDLRRLISEYQSHTEPYRG